MAISIGNSNAIPFINNRYANRIPKSLRDSMVFYYDIAKQKATNESLSVNPVLEDLSFKYKNVDWKTFGKYSARGDVTVSDDGHSMTITKVIITTNIIEDTSADGEVSVPMKVTITGIPQGAVLRYRYETEFNSSSPNPVNKYFGITEDGDYILPYSNVTCKYNMGWSVINFTGECNITITQRVAHDMQLHNFTFGGLSGVGTTAGTMSINSGNVGDVIISNNGLKAHIDNTTITTANIFICVNFNIAGNFRIKVSNYKENINNSLRVIAYNNEPSVFKVLSVISGNGIYDIDTTGYLDISGIYIDSRSGVIADIEILPYYENALVFNGTAPKYVYNLNNLRLSNIINTISYNKGHISALPNGFILGSTVICNAPQTAGTVGEPLTINIPAFYIRVTGLEDGYTLWINIGYKGGGSSFTWESRARNIQDGVTKIPAYSRTIEPLDENSTPEYIECRIGIHGPNDVTLTEDLPVDITIEFLPIYDAATTTMYADIPNIPLNKVKTMIMDFVPLSDNVDMWYYTQRSIPSSPNFAIVNRTIHDGVELEYSIAYTARNNQGTYINGEPNSTKTSLSLVQERHTVAVKSSNNNYTGIYIGHNTSTDYRHQQMALYSLIGFDRVLSDSEIQQISDILKNR